MNMNSLVMILLIKGSALNALNSPNDDSANKCIAELMDACDSFIPEPKRDVDKPFNAC